MKTKLPELKAVFCSMILLGASLATQAKDVYVQPVGGNDATGDGSNALPYATFTKALTEANTNGDMIYITGFVPVYTERNEADKTGFKVEKNIRIIGIGDESGFDGQNQSGLIELANRNGDGVSFKNLTFKNAKQGAGDQSGACKIRMSNAIFEDCLFANNTNTNSNSKGGAVFYQKQNENLTFLNCRFEYNSAKEGGAVNIRDEGSGDYTGKIRFENCSFTGNSSDASTGYISGTSGNKGGAICIDGGIVEIDRCQFINNVSSSRGGVFFVSFTNTSWTLNVTRSVFDGNVCNSTNDKRGGVLFYDCNKNASYTGKVHFEACAFLNNNANQGGVFAINDNKSQTDLIMDFTVVNSTFYGNTTTNHGAAVYLDQGKSTSKFCLVNCTFTGNSRHEDYGQGGVIRIQNNAKELTTQIYNSILDGNTNLNDVGFDGDDASNATGLVVSNSFIETIKNNFVVANFTDTQVNYGAEVNINWDAFDETAHIVRLREESAAFGAGNLSLLTPVCTLLKKDKPTDQLGHLRPYQGETCDAGAVERYEKQLTQWTGAVSSEWNEAGNWSNDVPEAGADVVIAGNAPHYPFLNANGAYIDITVEAGGQLTVNDGVAITAESLTLTGNPENGMATFIDKGTANITVANVKQTLSTENGRSWYYLASPVTAASSELFGDDVQIGSYDETAGDYSGPFAEATSLVAGKGYVVCLKEAVSNPTYTFSGALNNGAVSIPLTRGETGRGFNLVGNPYPSYLDWDEATKTNIASTIWTRSYTGSAMQFYTYNADAQISTDEGVTAHIAPLQAFWVRVSEGNTAATLELANDLRLHKEEGDANLRAAKDTRQLLRLSVSNGTNTDNTVILFDERATNDFDPYDSEKMSNNNDAIPEIYTLAGTEALAINTLAGTAENSELPLGFKSKVAGTFNISINKRENIENVTLIDNGTEIDLTTGSHAFTSDITDAADRFVVALRASKTQTGLQNAAIQSLSVYAKDSRIIVHASGAKPSLRIQVFNAAGQKLAEQLSNNVTTLIDRTFEAGIYLVKINGETRKIIVK